MFRKPTQVARNLRRSAGKALRYNSDLSYSQLCSIERRRRAILRRSELPFYKMLTFWDGTSLSLLFFDPLLWLTMGIFVAIRIKARLGIPDHVADTTSWGNIAIIGGFLSFFLVFYVNQSNSRFDAQYERSMDAKECVLDVASLARVNLPRERALRLVRYLNASHVVAYVGLSDTYGADNFFSHINKSTQLLTAAEYERIRQLHMETSLGSAHHELVAWCQMDISTAQKDGLIDPRLSSLFRAKVLDFQTAISALYNYADEPVSFFYVHFICVLSTLYLPLFAVSTAFEAGIGNDVYWTADLVSGLIVFLQTIHVIGLRLLGQKMADPYGSDLEDLSVMHYVNFTWRQSNRIVSADGPPEEAADAQTEEEICCERASIGEAWERVEKKKEKEGGDGFRVGEGEGQFTSLSDMSDLDTFVPDIDKPEPAAAREAGSFCVIQ